MNDERKTLADAIKGVIGDKEPTKEMIALTDRTEKFYNQFHDGKVCDCVTKTMVLYTRTILPELSMRQAIELTATVHTMIKTVLSYFVEDGIIGE
jgi:hypothetical protein